MTRWLNKAYEYIDLKEIAGPKHNPQIVKWWKAIKSHFVDDETPWCAAFVGGILEECGIKSARSARARAYMTWGKELAKPIKGCIVVFWRGSKTAETGHVGFVVGQDKEGNLLVIGGNQGNKVSMLPFAKDRVLSYRWPISETIPFFSALPVMTSYAKLSENEA